MGIRGKLSRPIILFLSVIIVSCSDTKKESSGTSKTLKNEASLNLEVPKFNEDSAYNYLASQVSFGPRIPNTRAHTDCGDYLLSKLESFGVKVEEQQFKEEAFDGTLLYLRNIIGSINPSASKRILLAAHWDTRPFSDKDEDDPRGTFDGANDGASGVAVLLEIARIISQDSLQNIGLDFIFFDGEDYGEPHNNSNSLPLKNGLKSWWCLGSQYWSNNKHQKNYNAFYGILLDMVGAKGATFYKEGYSMANAPSVVNKVWKTAQALGYGSYFVNSNTGQITDDHVFVNEIGKIPMIDIIDYKSDTFFFEHHHTQKDDLDYISEETLKAVGQTVLQVIYQEDMSS
ncbi:MAG: M28 family peptidase [Bacteroidota bacterium]